MKRMILIGVVLAVAAAGCGEATEDAGATTSVAETDTTEATETGGTVDEPETSDRSEDQSQDPDLESGVVDPSTTTIPGERVVEDENLPERVPPAGDTPAVGEADSSLVASIKQDLIGRTEATESAITVVRSEEVIWNDGSLGCPEPGGMYTQALVNGFWVVLEHDGKQYDYRANDKGFFRLCEAGGAPPSNPTG